MIFSLRGKFPLALAMAGVSLCSLLAAAGCATSQRAQAKPQPGQGIVDYQELVDESQHAITRALAALDRVSHASPCCSHREIERLSDAVHRLQVDSLRIRTRVQAVEERGDAWFQNWHQHVTQISDPHVRALATEHRAELKEHFVTIKANAVAMRAAFGPFLNGLREIRTALEQDPAAIQYGPMQDHIHATRTRGQEVLDRLAATRGELKAMRTLVTPGG